MKIFISTDQRTIIFRGKEDVGIQIRRTRQEVKGFGKLSLKKDPADKITGFAGLKTGFDTLLGLDLTEDPEDTYFKTVRNVETIQDLTKILLHEIGFMIVSLDGKEPFSDACGAEVVNKSFTELITVIWRINYLCPESCIKLKDNFVGETLHVFGVKALGSLVGKKTDFASNIGICVHETGNSRYTYVKTLMAKTPISYEMTAIRGYEALPAEYKKQEIDKDLFVPAILYLKQKSKRAPIIHRDLFDMFTAPLGGTVTGRLRTWVGAQMTGVLADEYSMGIMIRNVAPLKEIMNLVQKLVSAGKLRTFTVEKATVIVEREDLTPEAKLEKIRVEMVKEVPGASDMIHTVAMNLTSARILEIADFAAKQDICHILLFGDGPTDSAYDEGDAVMDLKTFNTLKTDIERIKIGVPQTRKKLKVVNLCRLWDRNTGPLSGLSAHLDATEMGAATGYGGQAYVLRELFDYYRFIGLCGNKSGGLDLGAINGVPSIQLQVFSNTRMLRERFGTLQLCSPCWRVVPTQSRTVLGAGGNAYLPIYIKHLKDNHAGYRIAWFYILSQKGQRTVEVIQATEDLRQACTTRSDLKLVYYEGCPGLIAAQARRDAFLLKSSYFQQQFVSAMNQSWKEETPP